MLARLSLASAVVVGFVSFASAQGLDGFGSSPSGANGAIPTTVISMGGSWSGAWPEDGALGSDFSNAPGESSGWTTATSSGWSTTPVATPAPVTGGVTTHAPVPIGTASAGTGTIIGGKNSTSTGNGSSGNTVHPPSTTAPAQSTNNAGSMVVQVGSVLAGVAVVIGFVL
jgi:hypothetical protein